MNPNDLRSRLRHETMEWHRRTEEVVQRHAPLTDLGGYARFLLGMRRAHVVFGEALARAALTIGFDPLEERIRAALTADLAALDVTPDPEEDPAPDTADSSPSRDLGVLYVFEGSALGSNVLNREVRERYGESATTEYLGLLSDSGSSRWPHVIGALTEPPFPVDADTVVAGANHAFRGIVAIMETGGGRVP